MGRFGSTKVFILSLVLATNKISALTWKDEEFFINAYAETGRPMKNATYLQQNVTRKRLTCNPADKPNFDLKDGDECEWKQPNGKPMKFERIKYDEAKCELILEKLFVEDGGTYTCMHVRNGGLNRPVYERDVVVYEPPTLHVINRRHYSINECDRIKINQFIVEMRSWLCIGRPTHCIFNIEFKSCEGVEGASAGRKVVEIEITRYLNNSVVEPTCNLDCIRNTYEKMLLDKIYYEGMDTLKSNEPVMEEISGFTPLLDRNVEVLGATCRQGFFVYKDIVCMPCAGGYYKTRDMDPKKCQECGYFYYQPKLASNSCIPCPWLGFSNMRNKVSELSCTPMYMTWQFMTVVSIVPFIFIYLLATGVITKCTYKMLSIITPKNFYDRDQRLTKKMVFTKIASQETGKSGTSTPSRIPVTGTTGGGQMSPSMYAALPKELTSMGVLSVKDAKFLAKDMMANVKNLSLTHDPSSVGLSQAYRKQQKHKFRVDDEELPEAIKKRQHAALGWTDKFDTSRYSKLKNYENEKD